MLTSDYLPHKIYAGLYILLTLLLWHLIKGLSNLYPILLELCFDPNELWTRMQYWFSTYIIFYCWIISKISMCSLSLRGFLRDFRAVIAGTSGLGVLCQMCCLSTCGFTGTYWWLLVWEAIRNFCPALIWTILFSLPLHSNGLKSFFKVWFAIVWHLPFHLHQGVASNRVTRSQQQHSSILIPM